MQAEIIIKVLGVQIFLDIHRLPQDGWRIVSAGCFTDTSPISADLLVPNVYKSSLEVL